MRILIVFLTIFLLTGCGAIARRERDEQQKLAVAQMQAGFEQCRARFPDGSKQFVAKQQCDSAAAQAIRPFLTYPDLFDRDQSERAVIAERLQAGRMTLAEANQAAAESKSKIAEDEQRRNLANRSVGAQESAAAAAWRASAPVSCTRTGNTTNCY